MKNHAYIKSLLKPNGSKPTGRRVWSVDLEAVWLPLFTATNTTGDTVIPHDALGSPLRLAYNQDGTVKFSKSGKPVVRVAKHISDSVKMVRDNLVAHLTAFAHEVATANPEGFKAQIAANQEAGKPIIARDREAVELAMLALAEAEAEALRVPAAEAPAQEEREAVAA